MGLQMRMNKVCCFIMSVTLLYPVVVDIHAVEQADHSQETKTIHQNDRVVGRNSKSLSDIVIPESLAPSSYFHEQIQVIERPGRPELPDSAVRPERPEKPARPDKPVKPEIPTKPDKPIKPVKPQTGRH